MRTGHDFERDPVDDAGRPTRPLWTVRVVEPADSMTGRLTAEIRSLPPSVRAGAGCGATRERGRHRMLEGLVVSLVQLAILGLFSASANSFGTDIRENGVAPSDSPD